MRVSRLLSLLVCGALMTLGSGRALAQDGLDGDRRAVAEYVASSVADVERCLLAQRVSRTPVILAFCRDIAPRRQALGLAGLQLGHRLGDALLAPVPPEGFTDRLAGLGQLTGHTFDRAFAITEIVNGESDLDRLRYANAMASDRTVRTFVGNALAMTGVELNHAEIVLRRITPGG